MKENERQFEPGDLVYCPYVSYTGLHLVLSAISEYTVVLHMETQTERVYRTEDLTLISSLNE